MCNLTETLPWATSDTAHDWASGNAQNQSCEIPGATKTKQLVSNTRVKVWRSLFFFFRLQTHFKAAN